MKKLSIILLFLFYSCADTYNVLNKDIVNDKYISQLNMINRDNEKVFVEELITKINNSDYLNFPNKDYIIIINPMDCEAPKIGETEFWLINKEERQLFIFDYKKNITRKKYEDLNGYKCAYTDEFIDLLLNKKYDEIKNKIINDNAIVDPVLIIVEVKNDKTITLINTINTARWLNMFHN